ncbi:UvrD-helicase domain-containing protein [Porticoccaceae bacterium]|nr:UvrD-helicase domain-containing protein [Porticoccaceae bacterium]
MNSVNSLSQDNSTSSDSRERKLALDPQKSFIVSAPAGSGKTGLITQRVLRLLCTVDNPEEILCITFTRKAAGEMTDRINGALQEAALNPRPDNSYQAQTWDLATAALERSAELGWNLVEMPGRLRIQTIDGFCRYIASQFALETSIGLLPEPSENPQVHYRAAARALLDCIEEDTLTAQHLAVLLAHTGNDLDRCETLMSELLGNREEWLPLIYAAADNQEYFQQVIDQIIGENLLDLEEALLPIAGELVELVDFAARHVSKNENPKFARLVGITELPDNSLSGIAQWKVLLRILVTKENDLRKTIRAPEGFPKDDKPTKDRMLALLAWCRDHPAIEELIANTMNLPDSAISESQQAILNALGYLLPLLAAQLTTVFQQQEQCDYPAITLAALEALEPSSDDQVVSDITLRLDYQLRHILVDEFQDTSGSQINLLSHLIAGWEQNDGRSLFLVGDAMQSLYRFRNANVGLFLNAQHHPIGPVQCQPLSLTTNFRSQKGVIDWVNETFDNAFPAHGDPSRGAIPYSASVSDKPQSPGDAVRFYGISAEHKNDYRREEARTIARICSQIQQRDPSDSVAILVRGRGHLRSIIPALREANLQWQAIDINPLANRMPVVDMLSLTRALISPADRIAWLAVLRAPFCGLGLDDLLRLTNSADRSGKKPLSLLAQLQQLDDRHYFSKTGQQTLDRITPIILQAWQNRGRDTIRNTVERLWLELGGPATLHSPTDIADVRRYLDLLEAWQSAGGIEDWSGFQLAVEKLYAAASADSAATDGSPTDNSPQPIQIMTIHKSKGLEFDHVLLPGLAEPPRSPGKALLRWQEQLDQSGNSSLIMAPLGAYDEEDDTVYRYLKHEDGVKSRLENTRVLYVGATRAIEHLYLFGKLSATKKGWKLPSKSTLLGSIWKTISAGIENGQYGVTEAEAQETETNTRLQHFRRLRADFKPESLPNLVLSTGVEYNRAAIQEGSVIGERDLPDSVLPDKDQSIRARHLGTVLHRTLKQLAIEGIDNWPLARRQRLAIAWAAQLKELGILATEPEINGLSQSVETMLADQRGKWILDRHSHAYCEQSLSYSSNGRDGTSIIDRTFVDNGVRWIVDYKYASPITNEAQLDFIARQTQAYSAQLRHYANLYRQLESNPVRCALYFPKIPMFIEIEAD